MTAGGETEERPRPVAAEPGPLLGVAAATCLSERLFHDVEPSVAVGPLVQRSPVPLPPPIDHQRPGPGGQLGPRLVETAPRLVDARQLPVVVLPPPQAAV